MAPHIFNTVSQVGLVYNAPIGPWPCEQCKEITQFAEVKGDKNHIYCVNEYCRHERIVDKKNRVIVEPNGTHWLYNPNTGQKVQITPR